MTNPASNSRSVEELFEAALASDDDLAWNAIAALHWRGSREVPTRAAALTRSPDPFRRSRGADVLAQLGVPERSHPRDCLAAVLPLLADPHARVVRAAVLAIGMIDAHASAASIIPLADHPSADVRHAVAVALGGVEIEAATDAPLRLMVDADPEVRNWASFGIGLGDVDGTAVRSALLSAIADEDEEVRYEAVIALAARRDIRAVPGLQAMLRDDPDDPFAYAAAVTLFGIEEQEEQTTAALLGALERRRRWRSRKP